MLQTLECPNCKASLNYDAGQRPVTVRCDYCGSTVIVPETLRSPHLAQGDAAPYFNEVVNLVRNGRKIEAIKLFREHNNTGLKEAKDVIDAIERNEDVWLGGTTLHASDVSWEATPTVTTSGGGCARFLIVMVIIAVLILVGVGAASFFIIDRQVESFDLPNVQVATVEAALEPLATLAATSLPAATAEPDIAEVVMEIGGQEGTGPGFFNDTRRLAVDGAGNIYVGDYSNGRIQVFDAEGNFLNQWNAGDELYMVGMTVDRQGTLYLVEQGNIVRFDGQTGTRLDAPAVNGNFRTLGTGPDGKVVAVSVERLLRFDGEGNIELDIADPFATIPDFATTHEDVAIDGAGNIYVAGSEAIYKLDSNGRFLDKIGSRGDAADQFQTPPTAVAVDGQGRLIVADFKGIMLFDSNGRYLDLLPFRGVAFDMWVTDNNDLLVMDRNGNRIVRYRFTG